MKKIHGLWPPLLALMVVVCVLTGNFSAGVVPGVSPNSAGDEKIYVVLRKVINHGADLFNQQRDYGGCYRVYEAALVMVRPLLGHHSDLQKAIDKGIMEANANPSVIDKAFVVRKVLDQIRERLKPGGVQPPVKKEPPLKKKPPVKKKPPKKKPVEKKKVEKKKPEVKKKDDKSKKPTDKKKKVDDKKKESGKPPAANPARLSGKVSFEGKPLPIGYVTVHGSDGRSFSTYIRGDGSFAFKTDVPAGKYRVTVELAPDPVTGKAVANAPNLPARFQDPAKSKLVQELRPGANELVLELKK